MDLHPRFLEENGRKVFVVLAMDEFEQLKSHLEDLEDLLELRTAKKAEAKGSTISLSEARAKLAKRKLAK